MIETGSGLMLRSNANNVLIYLLGFTFMCALGLTAVTIFQDKYWLLFLILSIVLWYLLVMQLVIMCFSWNAYIYFEHDRIWQKKWNKVYIYDWNSCIDCILVYQRGGRASYPVFTFLLCDNKTSLRISAKIGFLEKLIKICPNEKLVQKLSIIVNNSEHKF